MLLEELRRRVGVIAGLVEELRYDDARRWVPCYRVGDNVLFTTLILPAALEATVMLEAAQRDRLLRSRKLSSAMKQSIQEAELVDGRFSARVRLNNRTVVRAFVAMIVTRSRLS